MSDVRHAPGTFCWAELITTDSAGAKQFYIDLMGWEANDDPIPGGGVYTMLQLGGRNVGALYEQPKEMKAQRIPPCWMSYVTVDNAADTAARAGKLGGSVIKDAFDVFDIGSMAVLQDPTGAVLAVWQPKKHHGVQITGGAAGSMCWNELSTGDVDGAGKFYSELFGWKREIMDMPMGAYTMFMNGEARAGGMMELTEDCKDIPPHWMVYFSVADCDATAKKAAARGGKVLVQPMDIPRVGRFTVIQDPQGAACSFVRLERG